MVFHPSFGETKMETCPQENGQGGKAASVHGHAEGQISAYKVMSLDFTRRFLPPASRLPPPASPLLPCTMLETLEARALVACVR